MNVSPAVADHFDRHIDVFQPAFFVSPVFIITGPEIQIIIGADINIAGRRHCNAGLLPVPGILDIPRYRRGFPGVTLFLELVDQIRFAALGRYTDQMFDFTPVDIKI